MEAAEGDIEFANGRFTIAGTDRSIDIMELARRLREGKMPEGVPSSLDVDHTTKEVPSTFPNGCHVAEVEIDPDTGVVQIVRYTGVNDFGTIVNPMMVAGQLHGGVAQGIGQALMEEVSYDESGQPITGSFMDYALPRAEDIPMMAVGDHPCRQNPIRWAPRAAAKPAAPAASSTIVNAVLDALSEFGIKHIDMPLTPERVWRAIQDAKSEGGVGLIRRAPCIARQRARRTGTQFRRAASDRSRGLQAPLARDTTLALRPASPYAAACSRGW